MNRRKFLVTSGATVSGIGTTTAISSNSIASMKIEEFHINNPNISIESPRSEELDSFNIQFSKIKINSSNLKSVNDPIKLKFKVQVEDRDFRNLKEIDDIYMSQSGEKTIQDVKINLLNKFSLDDFSQPNQGETETTSFTIKMIIKHTDIGKSNIEEDFFLSITNTKESLTFETWNKFDEGEIKSEDSELWDFKGNVNKRIETDLYQSDGKSLLLDTDGNNTSAEDSVMEYSLKPAQYETFSFKYNERGDYMRGILMCLENSDGFTFIRFGTDNPQIDIYIGDGDSPEIHDDFSSSYYNEWIEISVTLDWENMTWKVEWNDITGNKGSKEFSGDLPNMSTKNVERVFFRGNGSKTESLSESSHGLDVNLDDITIPEN